jgi:hypothetical protein
MIGRTLAPEKAAIAPKKRTGKEKPGMAPVLSRYKNPPKSLRGKYKGKTLWAYVRMDGSIFFKGNRYSSPSKAGAVAKEKRTCNGWAFWYYQRSPGDWVRLDTLRR